MKREHLINLMLAGLTTGILSSTPLMALEEQAKKKESSKFLDLIKETGGNITYHKLDEEGLMLELNEEGAELYASLSPEGKQMALSIAGRACNGTNGCEGENACRTDKNACLGQGACKGQSKCAVSDKNLAVKLAAKKMELKRQEALKK